MLSSILDPLRELYHGPHHVPLPVSRVQVADIFMLRIPASDFTVPERDARRMAAWAPDGVLYLPDPAEHVCPRPSLAQQGVAFVAGCLAGAALVAGPIYTAFALILVITLVPGLRLPGLG
jgi:hypothetical protein